MRAWRWRYSLWAPFHATVATWLRHWQPEQDHLVLVGPSGGYALPRDFLRRFARITVLEPDSVARRLLRRRFPGLAFEFCDGDVFVATGGFAWLAKRHPNAALLFCNLLGQTLPGQSSGAARRAWLDGACVSLADRAWASWHDLASTSRPPDRHGVMAAPRAEPLEAVLARYWQGGELEISDHDCAGLCPDQAREYTIWPLAPRRFHLIEWISL